MWSHLTDTEERDGFFAGVRDLVRHLLPHREFLAQLTSGGGRVNLIVHLSGDVKMRDDLESGTLRLMSELGIGLGVEVFPKWN
jgi:hypothetical protein